MNKASVPQTKSLSYLLSVADNTFDIQISDKPLVLATNYDFVLDETCGGINAFVGTVRRWNKGKEITHLDFECYEAMAISELTKIAVEAQDKFSTKKISIHHRVGKVSTEEIAVIIAVSCKHRKASFQALSLIHI